MADKSERNKPKELQPTPIHYFELYLDPADYTPSGSDVLIIMDEIPCGYPMFDSSDRMINSLPISVPLSILTATGKAECFAAVYQMVETNEGIIRSLGSTQDESLNGTMAFLQEINKILKISQRPRGGGFKQKSPSDLKPIDDAATSSSIALRHIDPQANRTSVSSKICQLGKSDVWALILQHCPAVNLIYDNEGAQISYNLNDQYLHFADILIQSANIVRCEAFADDAVSELWWREMNKFAASTLESFDLTGTNQEFIDEHNAIFEQYNLQSGNLKTES